MIFSPLEGIGRLIPAEFVQVFSPLRMVFFFLLFHMYPLILVAESTFLPLVSAINILLPLVGCQYSPM